MAAIDDLITHIEDEALRERLLLQIHHLTKAKKFGLVFEEHLPELAASYSGPVREGSTVARRGEPTMDTWRVLATANGRVDCMSVASASTCDGCEASSGRG